MRRKRWLAVSVVAVLAALLVAGPGITAATGLEPGLCASCHVMELYRATFMESPHAGVTTCTDCHMPYAFAAGLKAKYSKGIHNISAVMRGQVPADIRLTAEGRQIVLDNCVSCHALSDHVLQSGTRSCFNCHAGDPHGEGVFR